MKIWTLGDAVVDLLPAGDMQYQACAGGAPLNVAAGAARLVSDTGFIGRIGDDPFGRFLKRTLEEQGVGTEHMLTDETHRTSTVVVDLATSGERSFSFLVNPSADQFLTCDDLPAFGTDILHYCSLALVAESCRKAVFTASEQIKQQGGKVSFDLNLREQMWSDKQQMRDIIEQQCQRADILKLSDEELFWLADTDDQQWDQALKALERFPAELKVITRGKEGGLVFCHGNAFTFAGYQVKSIDTTGAGDAFMAGLLAWVARHGSPQQDSLSTLLSQAGACGALATTRKGALPALPTPAQLSDFIDAAGLLTLHQA
ncbi:aminoimidazole riboside kinase [Tatumella saanichensis]|uniref:aminoimidazole riboside kinase n=1 Tax=Tatumella saanichensis TaxID=480813 RepID=UPI0004A45F03|nr:aminoimidazole riboside kinase [Tatumella saanichensis]